MKTSPQLHQRAALILAIATLFSAVVPNIHPVINPVAVQNLPAKATSSEALNSVHMNFEANRGQADADVKFVGRGKDFGVLLKADGAVLALQNRKQEPADKSVRRGKQSSDESLPAHLVTMKLAGANPPAFVSGAQQQTARANYFIGDDPSKWVRGVETYSGVLYSSVYRGIDLVFHSNERQLEYDFMVAPGADADEIRLRFDGVERVTLANEGTLILKTPAGELRHQRPVAYQEKAGSRTPVTAAFKELADGTIGFQVGGYDQALPLVIDPVLVYSTYAGGSASDFGRGITVDAAGNAYVVGDSFSSDFLFRASTTNSDVFIGILASNGLLLNYGFFGGLKNDTATGLTVDGSGNVYLCGSTESTDFPRVNSVGSALLGASDAFVVKMTPNLQQFFYSSLIGGSGQESGVSVATDAAGSAYIAGRTTSADLPLVGAIQVSYGGGDSDAFVSKLAPDGKTLIYSTYLGGNGTENLLNRSGISVDSAGNAYVTGDTQSANFPLKGAVQPAKNGNTSTSDAFVSVINPSGSDFVYSTYLGGLNDDFGLAIATDSSKNAYVAGKTKSTSFPGSTATRTSTTTSDAFVAKLNPAGSAISYLTFVGGPSGDDAANAITVDSGGSAVIAGSAGPGVPTVNAIQSFFKGGADDALIAKLSTTGAVSFSTYMGGSGDEEALGVALGADGAIYVTGFTDSLDFLILEPLRAHNAGVKDIFIAKIDPNTTSNKPVLIQAVISGKNLIVYGQNFQIGAVLRVNDEPTKTRNDDPDPAQVLFAKKAAKRIAPGQTVQLQVENPDGKRSNFLFFTKPL
ncbi:MAG TPA: SBBP repeat-containing protein [Blastocatellia bacterium]|nr:SBBP repeat-containing protein [Blastocatellia bacterium]